MVRRSLGVVALWLVTAAAALLAGLWAVGGVGSGITSAGPRPLSSAEVDALLTTTTAPAAPAAPASPAPAPAAPATGATVLAAPPGGTVVAACANGAPQVASVSPAQGWTAKNELESGVPRIRFEQGGARIELFVRCVDGRPIGDVVGSTHG